MAFSPTLSHVVLVITAGVLFYVALTDFKYFKIRNELILVLAGLFVIHALLSGRWVSAHWNVAFAVLMFGIMLYFYSQNAMGGGDVKILTIAFLWVGVGCAFPFAVLLAVCSALHVAAAKFGWAGVQQVGDRKRIPLAPSVAAAMILCFLLGCLQPLEEGRHARTACHGGPGSLRAALRFARSFIISSAMAGPFGSREAAGAISGSNKAKNPLIFGGDHKLGG